MGFEELGNIPSDKKEQKTRTPDPDLLLRLNQDQINKLAKLVIKYPSVAALFSDKFWWVNKDDNFLLPQFALRDFIEVSGNDPKKKKDSSNPSTIIHQTLKKLSENYHIPEPIKESSKLNLLRVETVLGFFVSLDDRGSLDFGAKK